MTSMFLRGWAAVSNAAARRHALLPAALAASLVACGGGGGDGSATTAVAGPPSTGATLSASTNEAAESAKAVVAGADAAVARASSMAGVSAALGSPIAVHASPASTRKQALAVTTTPCTDWVDVPCTGSATVDTNVVGNPSVVNPGDFLDIRFASVSGPLLGKAVVLNGRMRLDFQSTVDLNAAQPLAGANLRVTLGAFGGSVNGKAFGPVDDVGQLQFSSQGVASYTSAGARYTGLGGVITTGAGDYAVTGTAVRTAYWADATKFVDLALTNWRVAGSRPAIGALANVSGGQGGVSVVVLSASTTTVVYSVIVSSGGSTTGYVVTATYPQGGGAPVYTALPA